MADTLSGEAKKQTAGSEKIWSRDFVLILMSNFFIFLGFQMTLPTIPLFVEKLGGNDQLIGIVVGIFTFSALLLRPYAGHTLETKGRRFVYLTGLAIFVLSVGSFGFINSLIFLFVLRIIQGFGWGFSTTASGTIATDLIPAKRRGEGMGYFGLSGNIALAFGPTLGLALAGVISFKLLFLICALLGLAALVLSSRINYKQAEKQTVPQKRWDIYEKSALRPSFLLFFITVTFGGIASFLPIYSAQKGIGGIHWYFLLFAIALMLSRTFAGRLYDQRGHQAVFLPGAVLILAAMFLLAWLPSSLIMYIAAILYGLGFGSVQPALQAWSVKEAPANRRGMANATFFSFFDLGVGIGAIVFGQIAHLFGYSTIYLTAAGSVVISILLYIWILVTKRG
ncbi:MFS transporter [Cytobacillus firmus]|jgi:MFS family permease|uniref:MFS transporter n=2 Tax=Bacteria TaxID=2 RepID=A0AA46PIX8_CYTFI|nr:MULTISPECIES: MFS transporter [Bacillaceae]KML37367.1 MFS transporter [Cytobacillus firmus]MBG9447684.1 MFS transporter [Cytobacillus firmus]MCU1803891.1 MFS transporter [Cytobacillus firmus]USK41280.1 MFS transporter [Cytobacillus firmus]UYG95728.1 MFS transporter [Cytobacillus firmus]